MSIGIHGESTNIEYGPFSTDFKHRQFVFSVYLVPGRVLPHALCRVPPQHRRALHVLEAELAKVDPGKAGEVLGVGGLVPHLHLGLAHLDIPEKS
jgi:hypothetical protein